MRPASRGSYPFDQMERWDQPPEDIAGQVAVRCQGRVFMRQMDDHVQVTGELGAVSRLAQVTLLPLDARSAGDIGAGKCSRESAQVKLPCCFQPLQQVRPHE